MNKKPANPTTTQAVFNETIQSLTENVRRFLLVCGDIKVAPFTEPQPMTQAVLAERSGVPLSTLAKVLSGATKNPSLETICQIAAGIGVSPALLLMADTDWKLLLAGVDRVIQIVQAKNKGKNKPLKSALDVCEKPASVIEFAKAARELGNEFIPSQLHQGNTDVKGFEKEFEDQIALAVRQQIQGMFKFSAMADLSSMGQMERIFILILASTLGARATDIDA